MTEQTVVTKKKKSRSGKKNKGLVNAAFTFVIVFLVIYAGISIITQQAEISEKEKELQSIRDEITEAQQINDEYERILSNDDEKEYMERVAIERMGYGYANEKRYYAMSTN